MQSGRLREAVCQREGGSQVEGGRQIDRSFAEITSKEETIQVHMRFKRVVAIIGAWWSLIIIQHEKTHCRATRLHSTTPSYWDQSPVSQETLGIYTTRSKSYKHYYSKTFIKYRAVPEVLPALRPGRMLVFVWYLSRSLSGIWLVLVWDFARILPVFFHSLALGSYRTILGTW